MKDEEKCSPATPGYTTIMEADRKVVGFIGHHEMGRHTVPAIDYIYTGDISESILESTLKSLENQCKSDPIIFVASPEGHKAIDDAVKNELERMSDFRGRPIIIENALIKVEYLEAKVLTGQEMRRKRRKQERKLK